MPGFKISFENPWIRKNKIIHLIKNDFKISRKAMPAAIRLYESTGYKKIGRSYHRAKDSVLNFLVTNYLLDFEEIYYQKSPAGIYCGK